MLGTLVRARFVCVCVCEGGAVTAMVACAAAIGRGLCHILIGQHELGGVPPGRGFRVIRLDMRELVRPQ